MQICFDFNQSLNKRLLKNFLARAVSFFFGFYLLIPNFKYPINYVKQVNEIP